MSAITVIGPHSLFRAGLVSLLNSIGFDSIEEGDNLEQFRWHCDADPTEKPFIIAIARGVDDIIGAVHELRAWAPAGKIVVVAPELDLEIMSGCFTENANGYLLESISGEALRESLKLVSAGENVFPSDLATLFPALSSKFVNPEAGHCALEDSHFSARELEILGCLVNGQSNKTIANNLNIAEATVKVHVKRILRKAHVANRTQAALWGIASGVTMAGASRKVGR